jgi:hypothetical protein
MEAWKISGSVYLAQNGIHQPYIAEISPYQYGSMSKRGKTQYDAKRREEWNIAGRGKRAWGEQVMEAYDAGKFTLDDPEVHPDAKSHVRAIQAARMEHDFQKRFAAASRLNRFTYETDVRVGDRVYCLIGGFYTTVTKVNRKSVRIESRFKGNNVIDGYTYNDADYTIDKCGLQWLHYNELQHAVRNGDRFVPVREGEAAQ